MATRDWSRSQSISCRPIAARPVPPGIIHHRILRRIAYKVFHLLNGQSAGHSPSTRSTSPHCSFLHTQLVGTRRRGHNAPRTLASTSTHSLLAPFPTHTPLPPRQTIIFIILHCPLPRFPPCFFPRVRTQSAERIIQRSRKASGIYVFDFERRHEGDDGRPTIGSCQPTVDDRCCMSERDSCRLVDRSTLI